MTFQVLADASPEIEAWKMVVTLAGVLITAGATLWNVFLSRRIKRQEQNYGAQISKALREHELEMDKQEAGFKATLDQKTKEYQSQLEEFAFQNQIRFSMLHSKRVEFGAELFARLLNGWTTLGALRTCSEPLPIFEDFRKVCKEAYHLNLRSRFYFPKGITDQLQNFIYDLDKAATEAEWGIKDNNLEKFVTQWQKCEERLDLIADFFQKYLFEKPEEENN
jgi:hypothetical protein